MTTAKSIFRGTSETDSPRQQAAELDTPPAAWRCLLRRQALPALCAASVCLHCPAVRWLILQGTAAFAACSWSAAGHAGMAADVLRLLQPANNLLCLACCLAKGRHSAGSIGTS